MSVVQGPIGNGCPCDTGAKHFRRLEHKHERHVAAVAPTPNADTRGIHETLRSKPMCPLHLIGYFDVAHLVVDGRLERGPAESTASVVQLEHDVAGARQNLCE